MLPNFFIGGAAAAGTSFLSSALAQHPQIYLPLKMRPEPHYFYKSWEYEKPITYYENKYFSKVAEEVAVGERSSSYLYGKRTPGWVYENLPEIKWIFCLRNPVERTFANYRYTVLEGLEELGFEQALDREQDRIASMKGIWKEIQPHDYTGRGFYGKQIQGFLEYFPLEKMLIIKSEEMRDDPQGNFERIYSFLGVNNGFIPKLPTSYSSPSVWDRNVQVQVREYFKDRFDSVIETIRITGDIPESFCLEEDLLMARKLKDNLRGQNESMSDAMRNRLKEMFSADLSLLEELTGFSVESWR